MKKNVRDMTERAIQRMCARVHLQDALCSALKAAMEAKE